METNVDATDPSTTVDGSYNTLSTSHDYPTRRVSPASAASRRKADVVVGRSNPAFLPDEPFDRSPPLRKPFSPTPVRMQHSPPDSEDRELPSYYMPVNAHRKLLRGEILYVTKDTRESEKRKRRRKYCCISWIFLAIAAAIVIAALAGAGVLFRRPNAVPVASFTNDSSTLTAAVHLEGPSINDINAQEVIIHEPNSESSSIRPSLPQTTSANLGDSNILGSGQPGFEVVDEVDVDGAIGLSAQQGVPEAVEGHFRIVNMDYQQALSDPRSWIFQYTTNDLTAYINSVFNRPAPNGDNYNATRIISIKPGSLVHFQSLWNRAPSDWHLSALRIFNRYLDENRHFIGNYQVDGSSVSMKSIFYSCRVDNGGCSHVCEFDLYSMQQYCLCPPNMALVNSTFCSPNDRVSQQKSTLTSAATVLPYLPSTTRMTTEATTGRTTALTTASISTTRSTTTTTPLFATSPVKTITTTMTTTSTTMPTTTTVTTSIAPTTNTTTNPPTTTTTTIPTTSPSTPEATTPMTTRAPTTTSSSYTEIVHQNVVEELTTPSDDDDVEDAEDQQVTSPSPTTTSISVQVQLFQTELPTTTQFVPTSTQPEPTTSAKPVRVDNTTSLMSVDSPVCSPDQYLCVADQRCLPILVRCNGNPECPDGSDEWECNGDCRLNFKCATGKCIPQSLVCDGVRDCGDGSDEQACTQELCQSSGMYQCVTGYCLENSSRCDNVADCLVAGLPVDEFNCVQPDQEQTCLDAGHFMCPQSRRCIPASWRCNGRTDCLNGEDEQGCTCSPDRAFRCAAGGCIDSNLRCNGIADCPDGYSDEADCLALPRTGHVQVRSVFGAWQSLCTDNWDKKAADAFCLQLGFRPSLSVFSQRSLDTSEAVYWLSPEFDPRYPLQRQVHNTTETSCMDVRFRASVTCERHRCLAPQDPELLNNPQFPFRSALVRITFRNSPLDACFGVLIGPVWVLTTANCLVNRNAADISVQFSSGNLAAGVLETFVNPLYQPIRMMHFMDSALLRLDTVVPISILPACLPSSASLNSEYSICKIWDSEGNVTTLSSVSTADCNNRRNYAGLISRGMECWTSNKTLCDTDVSSPIFCQSASNGAWHLRGFLSYQRHCGIFDPKPLVTTNLLDALPWIRALIGPGLDNSSVLLGQAEAAVTATSTQTTTTSGSPRPSQMLNQQNMLVSSPTLEPAVIATTRLPATPAPSNTTVFNLQIQQDAIRPLQTTMIPNTVNISTLSEATTSPATTPGTSTTHLPSSTTTTSLGPTVTSNTGGAATAVTAAASQTSTATTTTTTTQTTTSTMTSSSQPTTMLTTVTDTSTAVTTRMPTTLTSIAPEESTLLTTMTTMSSVQPTTTFVTATSSVATTTESIPSSTQFDTVLLGSASMSTANITPGALDRTSTPATMITSTISSLSSTPSSGNITFLICPNGRRMLPEFMCDGITQCGDGWDERPVNCWNATCEEPDFDRCSNGRCLAKSKWCDGVSQCPIGDATDELNCPADCSASGRFRCPEGKCIPHSWLCDGENDCQTGDDERNAACSSCTSNGRSFQCVYGGGCISSDLVCNGKHDCPDQSDEFNCLRLNALNSVVEVRTNGSLWTPVCWSSVADRIDKWSENVCRNLGYDFSVSSFAQATSGGSDFYEISHRANVDVALHEAPKAAVRKCPTGDVFAVKCGSYERMNLTVAPADWDPSVAFKAKSINSQHIVLLLNMAAGEPCIGTILSARWILTSHQCVFNSDVGVSPFNWVVLTDPDAAASESTTFIKRFVAHPSMKFQTYFAKHDLMLVETSEALNLQSGRKKAIALPQTAIAPNATCLVFGWLYSMTEIWGTSMSRKAQGTLYYWRTGMVAQDRCNEPQHYNGLVRDGIICGGFRNATHRSPCMGQVDGAPIICQNGLSGMWELAGIRAYQPPCNSDWSAPSLFSDVLSHSQWLSSVAGRLFY